MPLRRARIALPLIVLSLVLAAPAAAEPRPSSDLLLPLFEVDLDGAGRTTLFAVANSADETLDVRAAVYSNWGVEIVAGRFELAPGAVATANLRDWLVDGRLPQRQIGPDELAHVQAALAGQPSPRDGLYYGTEREPDRAVGYVTIRLASSPRHDALWGDYFWIDPGGAAAEGELLVDIDRTSECRGLCDRHLLRFLEGGGFDGGTEIVVWSDHFRAPTAVPPARGAIGAGNVVSVSDFHRETGQTFDQRDLDLLPLDVLTIEELELGEDFGWVDLVSDGDVYVGVRYAAEGLYSVAIQSWCLDDPEPAPRPRPRRSAIAIEKATNGQDADSPPGPSILEGEPIIWEYLVTNTGRTTLRSVRVVDDVEGPIDCPSDDLAAGESMLCTKIGVAVEQGGAAYVNVGSVVGTGPGGEEVAASDPSHYFGLPIEAPPPPPPPTPSISLEKFTNGEDADLPGGPVVPRGAPIVWHYVVLNDGPVALDEVEVTDDLEGVATCPQTTLEPGESMVCVIDGVASDLGGGVYANTGSARGVAADGAEATASDPSHYTNDDLPPEPRISLEKATNGHDADVAPGPTIAAGAPITWSYTVTNIGDTPLSGIVVLDDVEGPASCPQSALDPGESMTCILSGAAGFLDGGVYANVGQVSAEAPDGSTASDSDPSHHFNDDPPPRPAVSLEKATNGVDADTPPGPTVASGTAVIWTYRVTNIGNTPLVDLVVVDDLEGAASCPRNALAPGESMTCTIFGVALPLGGASYANGGEVTGRDPDGTPVSDSDPSHYTNSARPPVPRILVEKATNGNDADDPPGPTLTVGADVTWTYVVTNTGDLPLTGVTVTDDEVSPIICPLTTLAVGEVMVCSASGVAVEGQHRNEATARAEAPDGTEVTDTDPSHYLGVAPSGTQGCTPGYWKNHPGSWPPTGHATTDTVGSVFASTASFPAVAATTLLDALDFSGGPTLEDSVETLIRAAVAALLDAAHPGVDYPRTQASIVSEVDVAIATGDSTAILALKDDLDADNNLGCPL